MKDGSYYVGQTNNLSESFKRHSEGRRTYTKAKVPWKLVYTEAFPTRSEAVRREREIKSQKNRQYIESLLKIH
jgi:putative endonuclease